MVDKDIVIVGGGAVGHVLARGLQERTSFSIALIEGRPFTAEPSEPGFDTRVIALAKRSVDELTASGVNLHDISAVPIKAIQVTDAGAVGLCQLDCADYGVPAFGEVVAISQLTQLLHKSLDKQQCEWHCPVTVENAVQQTDHVELTLSSGETLTTKLLVLADGGRSAVAAQLGLHKVVEPYSQSAIICNVLTSEPHHHRAYERFTAHGPLALLPFNPQLKDRHSASHGFSVVWTVSPARATELQQADDAQFMRQLQSAFGYRQGVFKQVSERFVYPLSLQYAQPAVSHRVLTVGNAAQTLHPIAGQGFNLGLRDAVELIDVLAAAEDPGAFNAIQAFDKKRQGDRAATVTLTDSLVRVFSNSNGLLSAGRSAGLIAMDNMPVLKDWFVRQATGYGRKGI